jgi:hypothetical protein
VSDDVTKLCSLLTVKSAKLLDTIKAPGTFLDFVVNRFAYYGIPR